MKKNLMSVLILALLVVNLVFTGILTFSIVPATKNANALIKDVAEAIHLELNAGKTTGANNISMANIETFNVDEGATMTINLKKSEDGEDHYAVVSIYLSLDKSNDDYETYGATMASRASIIKDEVTTVVKGYTKDELEDSDNVAVIRETILSDLQAMFDSEFIVDFGFSSMICQ